MPYFPPPSFMRGRVSVFLKLFDLGRCTATMGVKRTPWLPDKWGRAMWQYYHVCWLHCCRDNHPKFGSLSLSSLYNCMPGCAGFSCRSKTMVLTAFCCSPVSRARLSVNVSAMRNSMESSHPIPVLPSLLAQPAQCRVSHSQSRRQTDAYDVESLVCKESATYCRSGKSHDCVYPGSDRGNPVGPCCLLPPRRLR